MTDQPTKGVWTRFYENSSAMYFQKGTGVTRNEVRLTGPDREANAALFIRAQHMDELVEALEPFMATLTQLEAEFLDRRPGRQEIILDSQTIKHPIPDEQYIVGGWRHTYGVAEEIVLQAYHFRQVAAILAKIKGAK